MISVDTLFENIEVAISKTAEELSGGDYTSLPILMQQFTDFSMDVSRRAHHEIKPHIERLNNIKEQLDTLLSMMEQQRDSIRGEMENLTSSGNAAKAYAKSRMSKPKTEH